MRTLAHNAIPIALLFGALIGAQAQSSNQTSTATGSITGRVTINGQAAPGVMVVAQLSYSFRRDSAAEATTDAEGHYQLTGLAAGHYVVLPLTPGFAASDASYQGLPGPIVAVIEGETTKSIDFALARGAIITGRVTDADGKPVIRERVNLLRFDARGQKRPYNNAILNSLMFETDDRGNYRLIGLPAGSYQVSAGKSGESSYYNFNNNGVYYPLTFYPGVTAEAQAKTIELKPGDEAANIDITVGRLAQAYSIFGRVVDSATSQPITKGQWSFSDAKINTTFPGEFRSFFSLNARGEFGRAGFLPGRYVILLLPTETGYYSEPVTVEITDRDITNLEIKARRGGSLSGVVTIEGNTDPAALKLLPQLYVLIMQQQSGMPYVRLVAPIKADGSFSQQGLPPGKVQMAILTEQGDRLLRIERNGRSQSKTFDVAPGEQITGLHLVMADNQKTASGKVVSIGPTAYEGSGSVMGKVTITGGTLPEGARLRVFAHLIGAAYGSPSDRVIEVSANGNFTGDNLKPGRYEFTLRTWLTNDGSITLLPSAPSQTVTVTNNAAAQVTLTLDLSAKEEKR